MTQTASWTGARPAPPGKGLRSWRAAAFALSLVVHGAALTHVDRWYRALGTSPPAPVLQVALQPTATPPTREARPSTPRPAPPAARPAAAPEPDPAPAPVSAAAPPPPERPPAAVAAPARPPQPAAPVPAAPSAPASTTDRAPPTHPPRPAPAPAEPPATAGREAAYLAEVIAHIERYKRYPQAARQRRIEGTVTVHLRLGTDGGVEQARCSGGHGLLRHAACQTVQRALPLPPPPPNLSADAREIRFRMAFRIRGAGG